MYVNVYVHHQYLKDFFFSTFVSYRESGMRGTDRDSTLMRMLSNFVKNDAWGWIGVVPGALSIYMAKPKSILYEKETGNYK